MNSFWRKKGQIKGSKPLFCAFKSPAVKSHQFLKIISISLKSTRKTKLRLRSRSLSLLLLLASKERRANEWSARVPVMRVELLLAS